MPDNPTQALLAHCAANPDLLPPGTRLALLEVAYASAPGAIAALLDPAPAALVLTGYSHLATAVTLEAYATGFCAADKPDAMGQRPSSAIAETLATGADLPRLVTLLQGAGIPATISQDAGQYLCNFTYRQALALVAERRLHTHVVFVHLPAISGTALAGSAAASMPLATLAQALALIVAGLARVPYSPPV